MIKKTITPLILTALVGSASASVIALETGTNVALGATGITYTTSGFDEDNGNGDLGVNPGDGMTLTITFSQAVDIEISATSSRFGNVFDGSPGVASGTFITDGSAWNFAAGSNAGNANFSMLSTTTNTNDTFGISQDNGASLSSSEFDWGTLTSTGVTSITWEINTAQREVVKFCADAAVPVPEPTSTALLGLGGLALLARRKK